MVNLLHRSDAIFYYGMEILGSTLRTTGAGFVAFAALRVHHRVLNEHKIDVIAAKMMRREQVVGVIGIALIIGGHLMETFARLKIE